MGHALDGADFPLEIDDLKRHVLLTGEAGADKNAEIVALAANVLAMGGGFTLINATGSAGFFTEIAELCRKMGRTQDLLCLNFLTHGNSDRIRTMTFNPFAKGRPSDLAQLLLSTMRPMSGSPGDANERHWLSRRTALAYGLMDALCWLRDEEGEALDVARIRQAVSIQCLLSLLEDERIPEDRRRSLDRYVRTLSGYRSDRGTRQSQSTLDNHGYVQMEFGYALSMMSDVYGHVFSSDFRPDVDLEEVVRNRRILLVLMPSLEISKGEIGNIGRLLVASFKSMIGNALSSKIEGSWEDVVNARPTYGSVPYLAMFDEIEHYSVPGLANMAACARPLGVSVCHSVRSSQHLNELAGAEGASILANLGTHIEGLPIGSDDLNRGDRIRRVTLPNSRTPVAIRMNLVSRQRNPEVRLRLPPLIAPIWDIADPGFSPSGSECRS